MNINNRIRCETEALKVKSVKKKPVQWANENRQAIKAYNDFVNRYGHFVDVLNEIEQK